MAVYSNLAKLGRVKLPSGTTYALIDVDGRSMLAPNFSTSTSYNEGDYVIYGDTLYRFKTDHAAGAWDSDQATPVTVGSEINRVIGLISGGVHYRGKTTTPIHDGSTDNPITVNGGSLTVIDGDMVTLELDPAASPAGVASVYATGTAYSVGTYLKNGSDYYYVKEAVTAQENTSISAIAGKLDKVQSNPMFIFAEGQWSSFGGIGDGLGDLAYKDSASGTYVKPSGTGSVTIHGVSSTDGKLVTTTITGTNGIENVSKMTAGTPVEVAKAGTAVVYGTADVGQAVTYGNANVDTAVVYGKANKASTATTVATAGSTFNYGTADVGTGVSVAQVGASFVYGNADVGTEVTYGNANTGTAVTGVAKVGSSKTFSQNAIKFASTAVDGDCLVFDNAGSDSVIGIADTTGVSITPAVASNTKLTPAVAADTTRTANKVTSTTITPAVSAGKAHSARSVGGTTDIYQAVDAPSTQTLTPAVASTSTLTPAVAAPTNQKIIPAVSNGSITPWTESAKTVAKAASSETTVATGTISSTGTGSTVVTSVTQTDSSATVTVGTTGDTVTVQ